MYIDRHAPFSISSSRSGMTFAIEVNSIEVAQRLQAEYIEDRRMTNLRNSDPGEYAAECTRAVWAAFARQHPALDGVLHTADGAPAHFMVLPE